MVKAFYVTCFIVVLIDFASAYSQQCAIGPEYWCKSFENAQDCGAVNHCTSTVWTYDDKYAQADSSTSCQWCQRIFQNTYKVLEEFVDDKDLVISTLLSECNSLLNGDLSSKCTQIVQNYGSSVISLMKSQRYATLCRLMSICPSESVTEKPEVIVGSKPCTWGPAYWCASLDNTHKCQSMDHCMQRVWSQQALSSDSKDTICQYCEYIIEKLRILIAENDTQIDIENWLFKTCSMLETQTLIDECKATMSQHGEEILVLIKNNIDPSIICHLGQMCKNAIIITRPAEDNTDIQKQYPAEQSQMLCNVIVRATHDLLINQQKDSDYIQSFLKDDCQKLSTSELIENCQTLVDQYGNKIYFHVFQNLDSSKICDNLAALVDPTEVHSSPCQLCTFVLATVKPMIDNEASKEDILQYLNEQICLRWDHEMKKTCQHTLETHGEDLIDSIRRGIRPLILCAYFQVCLDDITSISSPIGRDEMISFLKENVCYQLGIFEDSCYAIINGDTISLLQSIVNKKDGEVLCNLFGMCSTSTSMIDELSVHDDADKCKRCIDHFTRRKFIAEKVLNQSAEFLHHLCGQLPQEDECLKAVDSSINSLLQFIQLLNPQDICNELKICNGTSFSLMEPNTIFESNDIISQQILSYAKKEICSEIGSLSKFCETLVNLEGANALSLIAKHLDPHRVCDVIDICPVKNSESSCHSSCTTCVMNVENHHLQLASFLHGILSDIDSLCQRIPESQDCRDLASGFESIINGIINRLDPKRVCESLTQCLSSPPECTMDNDKCSCCQDHLNFRLNNFRTVINQITATATDSCYEKNCYSYFQSTRSQALTTMDNMYGLRLCQRFGICLSTMSFRLIQSVPSVINNQAQNLGSYIETFANTICSDFGDYKSICEHLIASSQNVQYRNIYTALLKNDPTIIDHVLFEQKIDTCDQCKNAVQTAKDFWMKELETVRNTLLQTCEHCSAKDQCQAFYNQRFDNIKQYLDNIDPQKMCENIHVCFESSVDTCSVCIERFQSRKAAVSQMIGRFTSYYTDLCQKNGELECQTYAQQIHDLIQITLEDINSNETCIEIGFCTTEDASNHMDFNSYEESLTNEIENSVCAVLGVLEQICRSMIKGDSTEIAELPLSYTLEDLMPIKEESSESSESSSTEVETVENLDESDGDKCQCCINRVKRRKQHVKFVGNAMFFALLRSCEHCPAKHQCLKHWHMTKEQFDTRIDHICPKRVCIHLGFCNKSSDETTSTEIATVETIDSTNSTCILCEYAMNMLTNYLKPQATAEEIEQSLQKMCSSLPSILQNQCHEYIDNYGPAIISMLIQDLDPSTVCHKLNVCTNDMNVDITHLTKANTSTCGICDFISTYLHFVLQRDPSKESIEHAVSTVCTQLSDEQKSKGQILVLLFGPYFEQLALAPGNNFCQELVICQIPMIDLQSTIKVNQDDFTTNTDLVSPIVDDYDYFAVDEPTTTDATQNSGETTQCTICLFVISYLDAALKYNKSAEAIEQALEKVCTIAPSKLRTDCEELVSTYGPILVDFIANSADPKAACIFLGRCKDSTLIEPITIADNTDAETLEPCNSCQSIMSELKRFINFEDETRKDLISLKEYCNYMTGINMQQQCEALIDEHKSVISSLFTAGLVPKIVCQILQICALENDGQESTLPTTISTPSTARYNKCDFGMSYWCTSRANAELCNAVELCERQVWSKNKVFSL